mgnify:CR=1 FL=1
MLLRVTEMSDKIKPEYYCLPNGNDILPVVRCCSFSVGNIIKYVFRAGRKQERGLTLKQKALEDYKKARYYLEDIIQDLEKEINGTYNSK